jgi:hypothetical protein
MILTVLCLTIFFLILHFMVHVHRYVIRIHELFFIIVIRNDYWPKLFSQLNC